MGRQFQEMDMPGVRKVPEGNGEQGKMGETDIAKCKSVFFSSLSPLILFLVMGLVLRRRNGTEKSTLSLLLLLLLLLLSVVPQRPSRLQDR